jgi:hypothetical protein
LTPNRLRGGPGCPGESVPQIRKFHGVDEQKFPRVLIPGVLSGENDPDT